MKEITYSAYDSKETKTLNVKDRISLVDQGAAATLIADGVFEGEDYCPYKYDFTFWYWILHEYTDFNLEVDADEFMEVIETTNITIQVRNEINDQQFDNIENSARELINRRLSRSEFDNLCANANRLLVKYDEQFQKFLNSKTGKKAFANILKSLDTVLASQKNLKDDVKE